jgi:hypothetical protein
LHQQGITALYDKSPKLDGFGDLLYILLPLQGVYSARIYTQGDALGYVLVGLSGR